jgi:hypothetical protein
MPPDMPKTPEMADVMKATRAMETVRRRLIRRNSETGARQQVLLVVLSHKMLSIFSYNNGVFFAVYVI